MEKKLLSYFLYWIGGMLVLVIIFSLIEPKGKKVNLQEIDFSTQKGSELYFKNMRSFFYDQEIRDDANFVLYRIDSRETDSSKNKLNFVLVSNWRQSECYVMAECNFKISQEKPLTVAWQSDEENGSFQLKEKDNNANYIFAAKLFEQLTAENEFVLIFGNEEFVLTEKEKKSLQKTLSDFFKLVGKVR
jgi:hypothetical protein